MAAGLGRTEKNTKRERREDKKNYQGGRRELIYNFCNPVFVVGWGLVVGLLTTKEKSLAG